MRESNGTKQENIRSGTEFLAGLVELADTMDSKSIARKGVPVQLRDPVLK